MKLSIAEILEKANDLQSDTDRKVFLIANNSNALQTILRCVFDPKVKFLLPEGKIEYTKNQLYDLEHLLYAEVKRLYLFIEGGNPNLTDEKRLKLFQSWLENISSKDADMMMYVKDKKLPYKTITKSFIKNAFPDLY